MLGAAGVLTRDSREIEYLQFALGFSSLANRRKHLGFKCPDQEDMEWYDVV